MARVLYTIVLLLLLAFVVAGFHRVWLDRRIVLGSFRGVEGDAEKNGLAANFVVLAANEQHFLKGLFLGELRRLNPPEAGPPIDVGARSSAPLRKPIRDQGVNPETLDPIQLIPAGVLGSGYQAPEITISGTNVSALFKALAPLSRPRGVLEGVVSVADTEAKPPKYDLYVQIPGTVPGWFSGAFPDGSISLRARSLKRLRNDFAAHLLWAHVFDAQRRRLLPRRGGELQERSRVLACVIAQQGPQSFADYLYVLQLKTQLAQEQSLGAAQARELTQILLPVAARDRANVLVYALVEAVWNEVPEEDLTTDADKAERDAYKEAAASAQGAARAALGKPDGCTTDVPFREALRAARARGVTATVPAAAAQALGPVRPRWGGVSGGNATATVTALVRRTGSNQLYALFPSFGPEVAQGTSFSIFNTLSGGGGQPVGKVESELELAPDIRLLLVALDEAGSQALSGRYPINELTSLPQRGASLTFALPGRSPSRATLIEPAPGGSGDIMVDGHVTVPGDAGSPVFDAAGALIGVTLAAVFTPEGRRTTVTALLPFFTRHELELATAEQASPPAVR